MRFGLVAAGLRLQQPGNFSSRRRAFAVVRSHGPRPPQYGPWHVANLVAHDLLECTAPTLWQWRAKRPMPIQASSIDMPRRFGP